MIRALVLLVALLALAWLATRRRPEACATWVESEDGVQPWDPRTVTLASAPAARVTWRSDNLEPVG